MLAVISRRPSGRLRGHRTAGRHYASGQTLTMFITLLMALVLFLGLGLDLGFAYITRARLSKAVDSACLAGMRAYSPTNQATAVALARTVFAANYGTSGRDVGPVTPTVAFNVAAANNVTLDVSASTRINTFFIRVLPNGKPSS